MRLRATRALAIGAALALGLAAPLRAQTVLRVVPGASGGDGSSWASAFGSLQDALAAAAPPAEIWLAAGTYRPDVGAGVSPGDVEARFAVPAGVSVYGGFLGGESSRAQRSWRVSRAILSGDLGADDGADCARGARSRVVLEARGDAASELDGFEVRDAEVGILLRQRPDAAFSAPRLRNLIVRRNQIGISVEGSNARLENLLVSDNGAPADLAGIGIRIAHGSPQIAGATIARNGVYGIETADGATLRNTIVVANPVSLRTASLSTASFDVAWSCIAGGQPGAGNLDCAPLFADADGADGIPGNADDDFRLGPGSPAIDAGQNAAALESADLDGLPRRADDPATADSGAGSAPLIDLGAYEYGDADGDGDFGPLDNCPHVVNPGQEDADANGVGDACTCGELGGDGLRDASDVTALRAHLAALGPALAPEALERCSAIGPPDSCDVLDRAVLGRALATPALDPGVTQSCRAAVGP